MNETQKTMINEFQCPGCVDGCAPEEIEEEFFGFRCKKHCPGTILSNGAGMHKLWLGLPKGFNRVPQEQKKLNVFLYESLEEWDKHIFRARLDRFEKMYKLNVPVWQYERDGYLFVKSFSPRTGYIAVDVIKGANVLDFPNTINIGGSLMEEID